MSLHHAMMGYERKEPVLPAMAAGATNAAATVLPFRLERQVSHLLRRAHQRASSLFADQFASMNLTPTQFAILAKLHERREVSQNHLGRMTAMDPATVQGVIRRLLARDLIAQRDDPNDRRRVLISLTDSGYAVIEDALPRARKISELVVDSLRIEEREQLVRLLRKIAD
ncbi:MarR family winged helix-turn-helix transcriptional regulator [Marinivivus vitaminiproducens]|uniref:MarR family winged helix-turn-helix transcriptional regulator n=1 Tax=Marinivivus vitaminiproducens TaxID=3035935 RepID=UPI0027A19441|nr:MarR family transcriptional regulator [Geminicoccaceae bacterium SCSIO 64248]